MFSSKKVEEPHQQSQLRPQRPQEAAFKRDVVPTGGDRKSFSEDEEDEDLDTLG